MRLVCGLVTLDQSLVARVAVVLVPSVHDHAFGNVPIFATTASVVARTSTLVIRGG